MKRGFVFLLIFFILIVNINITLSFEIGDLSHSLQESYAPSENIKGWINISLDEESANSLFEINGYSISLIDLLETNKNSDFVKTCNPLNCETDYIANALLEEFNLDEEESILFGFNLSGNSVGNLDAFSFDLISNNPESEELPLTIDILNDGEIEWKAYVGSGNFGSEDFGCFIDVGDTTSVFVGSEPYCEKIHLTKTSGIEIGAYVEGDGEVDFEMSIKKTNGFDRKTCTATATETGKVACSILEDFSIDEEEDYFVCIKDEENSLNYKIASETTDPCGFIGEDETYIRDYKIFASQEKYASSISFTLDNTESLTTNIEGYIENYLYDKYDNNCPNGCAIPIKISSGVNQDIEISNAQIYYLSDGGSIVADVTYDIFETPAKISSDFQQLYLDEGDFSVPNELGNYTFSLILNDEQIFSEKLVVGGVPIIESIKPRVTASAYPTEFEVTVDSEKNIIEYNWDFGNGDTEITTTNKVTYTYDSIGTYKLKITATDSSQSNSSKEFEIIVESPKEIINSLLAQMLTNLNNIKEQINDFDSFYQDSLEPILDINLLEDELGKIQIDNASATNEEDYNLILTDLLYLEIPESIWISTSADLISFYSKEENINLNILKSIGGGNYDTGDKSKYVEAILGWNQKNLETKINFNQLSSKDESSEKSILNIFELKINENPSRENSYLIIPKLDNLKFKEDYSEREKDEYFYIDLTNSQTTIIFSTTEDISFIDLPVFISPAISDLSIIEGFYEEEGELSKMTLFILIIILLVIIGIVAYVILQGWYKKKYENYLFKNRNDLYNLISYIQSSKKKGLENKDIIIKLKKAGWKSEQIRYIMRKYAGERTGMFEIPIGKILSKFKKKKIENIPPRRPIRNVSRSRTLNSGYNPRRNKKRFS